MTPLILFCFYVSVYPNQTEFQEIKLKPYQETMFWNAYDHFEESAFMFDVCGDTDETQAGVMFWYGEKVAAEEWGPV